MSSPYAYSPLYVTEPDPPLRPSHPAAAPKSPSPSLLTRDEPSWFDLLPPYEEPAHQEDSHFLFPDLHDHGASPTPPASNYLDNILNPLGLDHNRYSPFPYRPSPPPQFFATTDDMPPTTRARPDAVQRPARLANGYVDLTATTNSPPQRRKRPSPTPGPSAKRQRRDEETTAMRPSAELATVDEVDLTDDQNVVHDVLQKQREDAVKAQARPEEAPTTLNTFTCVICMDTPTDLTATACGHLFCHTCLMEALIAGENRTGPGETKRSQCPVCRKVISRTKAADIIPLLLMKKGLLSQPRKKVAVAPTAATAKV